MAAQGSGWRITSQVADQYKIGNAGQTIVGIMVYFITGQGNEGNVFIPENTYNHKTVHAAVKAQANLMDEIGSLSEGLG